MRTYDRSLLYLRLLLAFTRLPFFVNAVSTQRFCLTFHAFGSRKCFSAARVSPQSSQRLHLYTLIPFARMQRCAVAVAGAHQAWVCRQRRRRNLPALAHVRLRRADGQAKKGRPSYLSRRRPYQHPYLPSPLLSQIFPSDPPLSPTST
eukprot:3937896-Pleurochrysis_carterae.AAC.3